MADWIEADGRLPVPVTAYGPLQLLAHPGASAGEHRAYPRGPRSGRRLPGHRPLTGDDKTVRLPHPGQDVRQPDDGPARRGRRPTARSCSAGTARPATSSARPRRSATWPSMYVLRSPVRRRHAQPGPGRVLLDADPLGTDRHRSAMCSFAEAATAAEMYETAAAAYEQLCASDAATVDSSFDLVHAMTLLYWGLRLAHVGRTDEAREPAAPQRRDHPALARPPAGRPLRTGGMHALALAKLGDTPRRREAGPRGDHAAARRRDLPVRPDGTPGARHQPARPGLRCTRPAASSSPPANCATFGARPDERPIIRFEMALTALELDGGQSSRDLFDTVEGQMRELWRLRLQRLACCARPASARRWRRPGPAPNGDPPRPADRPGQPPRLRPAAERDRHGPAAPAAGRAADRPGPLQGGERRVLAQCRRPGAARGGRDPAGPLPARRRGGPLRRRRVRAVPAGRPGTSGREVAERIRIAVARARHPARRPPDGERRHGRPGPTA